jgi:hypothetical protein
MESDRKVIQESDTRKLFTLMVVIGSYWLELRY